MNLELIILTLSIEDMAIKILRKNLYSIRQIFKFFVIELKESIAKKLIKRFSDYFSLLKQWK